MQMIRAVINFFKGPTNILWPKVDSCSDVQAFVDAMCKEYDVPLIQVIVKSKNWVTWFAGEGVSACAFWHKDEEDESGRYIAFDGETCRISGRDRNTPIRIDHRWQVVEKVHTIIHEFIHHYFHHHYGINTEDHCKKFRKMETRINSEYGIYYVYGFSRYGGIFHNFWGWPYGFSKPTAKDRGWLC